MNGRGGRRGRDLPKLDQLKTADHPRHANEIHQSLDCRIEPIGSCRHVAFRAVLFADNAIVATVNRTFLQDH